MIKKEYSCYQMPIKLLVLGCWEVFFLSTIEFLCSTLKASIYELNKVRGKQDLLVSKECLLEISGINVNIRCKHLSFFFGRGGTVIPLISLYL
jgi:hypothetical protein